MRRRFAAVASLVPVLLLTACTGGAPTPVPREAGAPFVCAGVPSEGTALILGGDVVQLRRHGEWGVDGSGFQCDVGPAPGGDALIMVEEWDVAIRLGTDGDSALKMLAAQTGATLIEADSIGAGYTSGSADEGSATWVCADRMLAVDLLGVQTAGRDQRADAEALVVSMLPWACGGEDVPERTVEGR